MSKNLFVINKDGKPNLYILLKGGRVSSRLIEYKIKCIKCDEYNCNRILTAVINQKIAHYEALLKSL